MNKEKTYIIEGLDCANCAAKVERKLQGMPQIDEASLTFATKQLKIVSDKTSDSAFMGELEDICNSVESGITILDKESAQLAKQGDASANGGFWKDNATDLACIIIGAVLFAAGIIIHHMMSSIIGGNISTIVSLIVFAAAYFTLGGEVLLTSAKNISKGQVFDENFLMSIATIAAFCIGEFTEGVGVMLFYRIGELFEHIAVERSRSQIMDAVDMRPETVNLICDHDHDEHEHHHHDHDDHDHHHDHEEHDACCCCEDDEHDHEHLHKHDEHEHHHDHDACDCGCEDEHEHHDHEHEHHHHDHEHEHEHEEHIHIIPAEKANIDDVLLIRPGDRIPLDGTVVEGESRIDTAPVTGEPVPVSVHAGSELISGCINTQGLLKMQVSKPLSESMVTKILDSVENAAAGKPKIDKFITKFAKVYTPIVVILSVLTAIIPSLITGNWNEWITTAITFLVISCPCALVISVPLAFFAGIGAASKLGILFKGGLSIEALKNVKSVVMDKTGTLTKGNFSVQSVTLTREFKEEHGVKGERTTLAAQNRLLTLAAMCEASSTHPIAASITDEVHHRDLDVPHCSNITELSGMGIRAESENGTILCGNKKLMDSQNISVSEDFGNYEGTQVLVAIDGELAGAIYISDTIKPDAVDAVGALKGLGLLPAMLTGDSQQSANAVGKLAGIDRIYAQLLPDGKLDALRNLREETGSVMFVGDGINDAPVLAGADVGAAMGSGADAAIEAADVIFMRSSVEAVPKSIRIARRTGTIAMENVIFALAVKLIVLVLGFIGMANIWAAVFADTGVAMLCILNSLRLLWKKF